MAVHRRLSLDRSQFGQSNLSNGERKFKWTSDVHMKMAKYLSEHYDLYSAACKRRKRMRFLRHMTAKLDVVEGLDDTRIQSGFNKFLNKYELVKAKVNSGGEQPNGTAQEEILEQCPYFYILDETFSRTPKDIAYECVTEMSDMGNEVRIENNEEFSSEDLIVLTDNTSQQLDAGTKIDSVMVVPRQLSIDHALFRRKRERFKWTIDLYMKMAKYLSEHYDEYSAANKQGKTKWFLKTMTTKLDGLEGLDDIQIRNGFSKFLRQYKLVKAKVNKGGEQPDGTAHKEWILEQCPYFFILDATFARTPKDIVYEPETGDIGNEVVFKNDEESISEDSIVLTENSAQPEIEIDTMVEVRRSNRLPLVKHKIIGRNSECFIQGALHRKPFKWTRDLYMKMATYLSEHYDEYSAAIKQSEKRKFLRMMRTRLDGLEGLDRIQIRKGFWNLLNKYKLVKAKVNSGGVQPDGKAHKERIIDQCPFFYILDATFAKDVPPYVKYEPETGDIENEVAVENDEESSPEDSIDLIDNGEQQEIPEIDIDSVEEDKKDGECQLSSPVSPPNYHDCNLITRSPSEASHVKNEDVNKYYECRLIRPCTVLLRNCFDCDPITRSPSVASYVRDACKDIGVGKGEKRSIDTLIELSDGKVQDQSEVEKQKLKLEERKFAAQHAIQLKKLDIEHLKVKAKSERKAQRFAMKKAKAQQLREITKLRLQIELEKLKKLQRDAAEDK